MKVLLMSALLLVGVLAIVPSADAHLCDGGIDCDPNHCPKTGTHFHRSGASFCWSVKDVTIPLLP